MAHAVVATMIGGGLDGCGPSQQLPAVNWHHLHGADGADALQGIGRQWPIRSWQTMIERTMTTRDDL
jgi:hypothetical protein